MSNSQAESDGRYSRLSDRRLLHFFAMHLDSAAFAEIVRRYQGLVMNVCRRTTSHREDAEGAFQARFVALAKRPRQLRNAKSLNSWLYSVAWRTSVHANRFRRKHVAQILPDDYRTVLVMKCVGERTTQEISDELQTTTGVVDGRLKRAKNALRVRLVRRGVTIAALTAVGATAAQAVSGELTQATLKTAVSQFAVQTPEPVTDGLRRLVRSEAGSFSLSTLPALGVSIALVIGLAGWLYGGNDAQAADESRVTLDVLATEQTAVDESCKSDVADAVIVASPNDQPAGHKSRLMPLPVKPPLRFRDVRETELLEAAGEWGGISGRIISDGVVPERKLLFAAGGQIKKAGVCAAGSTMDDSLIVDAVSKGVANCFVYLHKAPSLIHPLLEVPVVKNVLQDQRGCQYVPHALLVRIGQTVTCISADPIAHNIHVYPIRNVPGNFVVAPLSKVGLAWKPARGEPLPIQVKCDFHVWMSAYWLVQDHPYAAITDAEGQFRIIGLAAGEYEFRIWHERVGYIDRSYKVTVVDGDIVPQEVIRVSADRFGAVNPAR